MICSGNLRTLAVFVVGICLVLPAFAAPIPGKVYIVKNLKSNTGEDFLAGVEVSVNENGEEVYGQSFGIVLEMWDEFLRWYYEGDSIIEEIPIENLPVQSLYEILNRQPELYSEFLPTLLSKSSPKEVAEKLPSSLFKTLTQEAKAKISPEQLEELRKLYEF